MPARVDGSVGQVPRAAPIRRDDRRGTQRRRVHHAGPGRRGGPGVWDGVSFLFSVSQKYAERDDDDDARAGVPVLGTRNERARGSVGITTNTNDDTQSWHRARDFLNFYPRKVNLIQHAQTAGERIRGEHDVRELLRQINKLFVRNVPVSVRVALFHEPLCFPIKLFRGRHVRGLDDLLKLLRVDRAAAVQVENLKRELHLVLARAPSHVAQTHHELLQVDCAVFVRVENPE
mmetsp:Transcript_1652/g.6282  ORF Transcript_1652/g.6282 Transcript_1652/m.6282 type:complete len:232 (+) Transcript_1652:809-1504(+)